MGMGDLRGSGGGGISVAVGMGGPLVLEPKTLQRIRREEGPRSDHLQCCLCPLLQSLPARPFRDHSHSLQRVTNLNSLHLLSYFMSRITVLKCSCNCCTGYKINVWIVILNRRICFRIGYYSLVSFTKN